uniref:DNA internalization-related competence protein ComEC/Rec2 n=1 Tax=uncultured Thiotrichaceae bacterium TaxID=298394 RepID=A0A6S6SB01_9GAMM|nr:MAG: DNA internalization-related competence protein ComEC/Rec2 [uncultured Thiotrichaceae bacterium]
MNLWVGGAIALSISLLVGGIWLRLNRKLLLASVFITVGFLYAWLHAYLHIAQQLPENLAGKDLILTGVISGLPEAGSESRRFTFEIEKAEQTVPGETKAVALSGKVKLGWYRHFPQQLNAGERWQLVVRAKPPSGFMNPGGFDYEKWLFAERIIGTGYVRRSELNQPLGNVWSGGVDALRQQVQQAIQYHLEDFPELGVIAALAVADRSAISTEQWEVLRRTGTSHLVAISGLHIALVAGFGFFPVLMAWWLFPRLYLWLPVRIAGGVAGAMAATVYALMAGFTLPTQRALVMVLIILVGLLGRRAIPFASILCWALLAVLLLDPLASLSAGFWLSFLAVLMIFMLTRRDLHRKRKWDVLTIQIGLSLGMIPLTAGFFGSASLVSPLANLAAVPYVSLFVVPLVLLGMIVLPFSEYLAAILWQLSAYAVKGLWWGLDWLAGFEWASLALPQLPLIWGAVTVVGFLLLIMPRGIPGRWLGVLLMMPVFLWQPQRPDVGSFELTVLDVGQGLASVIRTAEHTLIFDTGPKASETFDTGKLVVLPWLRAQHIDRIDGLVISHADNDHSGGALAVLDELPVERLITDVDDPEIIGDYSPEPCNGQWEWDGVQFEMLHPTALFEHRKRNNLSCVLRVSNGSHSVLFSGDIERSAEYWLSKHLREQLKSEVLIVPHHGSNSSSSPAFLKRVDPKIAVVSAGYRSRFKHPAVKVVKRYKDWGIPLLNTAESGAVSVVFPMGDEAFSVREFRSEERRFWNR